VHGGIGSAPPEGGVGLQILLALVLVLGSAYFVAAETALVALRGSRLKQLEEMGNPRDRFLLRLTRKPSEWLGAVQLGITIVNFVGGAAVIAVIAPIIAPAIEKIAPGYGMAISYVLVTVALTYVFLVFGELVPKMLAIVFPERISRLSAPLLVFFIWITYPFVWLISVSTLLFSRPFTKGKVTQSEVTEQEIEHMIRGHEAIPHFEKELARRIFKFGDTLAHEIMTPRPDVIAVGADATRAELCSAARASGKSRLPVYKGSIDQIIGIVVLKDALLDPEATDDSPVTRWLRPDIPFVPETLPILSLYKELEHGRNHFAVVIDEHGGTAGIVTLEDVVEEVFGDIQDEHDPAGLLWTENADGSVIAQGIAAVRHLNHELGCGLPEGEGYETVAGLVMDGLGRLPSPGDVLRLDNADIEVTVMKGMRISKVKITPRAGEAAGAAGSDRK
jgi:putative hemolysin